MRVRADGDGILFHHHPRNIDPGIAPAAESAGDPGSNPGMSKNGTCCPGQIKFSRQLLGCCLPGSSHAMPRRIRLESATEQPPPLVRT